MSNHELEIESEAPHLAALAHYRQDKQRVDERKLRDTQTVAGAALIGLGFGYLLRRLTHRRQFNGQNVLITGGSRGLGLQLVREFAGRGAQVVFCARHADEVQRAENLLHAEGYTNVEGMVADVSLPDAPAQLVASINKALGPVDILVNNAGQIQVGPFVDSEEEAFHRSLDLFLYGPLRLAREVLPEMMAAGQGTVVNITSIGGQIPAPHLIAYNCGKSAMVSLSEGMSVELDRYGVNVLTVKPGLMRTGSHRNAWFGGRPDQEYSWFSRAAINPGLAISTSSAAKQIVDAVLAKRRTLAVGWEAKLGPLFHQLLPETSHRLTSAIEKMLPRAGSDEPTLMGEIVAPEAPPLGPIMQRLERSAMEHHQAARYSVLSSPYPEA